MGIVDKIITQNVDGLHIKASPSSWSEQQRRDRILELHGTLHVSLSFELIIRIN
jgi:NAD-dependent SIR2 family protein deacetylase